ncbi:MAG: hypothetical protein OXG60_07760 [Chloroflexi bacterium]|nr:hypothetical protein [Chloroflexota bacterium]
MRFKPRPATKADLEKQTRVVVMWIVGVNVTLAGVFAAVFSL